MTDINLKDYKQLFLTSAGSYLAQIEEYIPWLEKDRGNKDALNVLFIAFHSLKSQCQVMGYKDLAEISELLEKQLRSIKAGKPTVSSSFLLHLSQVVSRMKASLDIIAVEDRELSLSNELATVKQMIAEDREESKAK